MRLEGEDVRWTLFGRAVGLVPLLRTYVDARRFRIFSRKSRVFPSTIFPEYYRAPIVTVSPLYICAKKKVKKNYTASSVNVFIIHSSDARMYVNSDCAPFDGWFKKIVFCSVESFAQGLDHRSHRRRYGPIGKCLIVFVLFCIEIGFFFAPVQRFRVIWFVSFFFVKSWFFMHTYVDSSLRKNLYWCFRSEMDNRLCCVNCLKFVI